MSNMMSMTMKQPVRPAPALQTETQTVRESIFMSIIDNRYASIYICISYNDLLVVIPAVDHNGPSRGWIGDFHSADEGE